MRSIYSFILTVLLMFSQVTSAYTQKFDHITTAHGISSNLVTSTTQDHMGFLWVGTKNGLNRYDGYSFQSFLADANDDESISGNQINDLLVSADGSLWVANDKGVDQYNASSDNFAPLPISYAVEAIIEWTDSTLLLGMESGIKQVNSKTREILDFELPEPLLGKAILSLLKDSKENLWVGTEEGLFRFQPNSKDLQSFTHEDSNENTLIDNSILTLLEDKRGYIWVGIDGGLSRLDPGHQIIRNYYHDEDGKENELAGDEVTDLFEDQDGMIWIATTEGINRYEPQAGTISTFIHDPTIRDSVAHSQINDLFVDKHNILWIGTNGGGLSKLNLQDKEFSHAQHHPHEEHSLGYDSVISFLEDEQGRIWVGLDDEGFNRYDPRTGLFERFEYEAEKFPSHATREGIYWVDSGGIHKDRVKSMQSDQDGNLWIGTSEGLEFFELENVRFRHFSPSEGRPHSLSHEDINSVLLTDDSTLWLATNGGGLNRFNPENYSNKIYRHIPGDKKSLSSDTLTHITQDKEGMLWIATLDAGVTVFDPKAEHFTHIPLNEVEGIGTANQLNNEVWSIHISNQGPIWFGTSQGLNRFDPDTQTIAFINLGNHASSTKVLGIVEDKAGQLWLSKERGLSKFDPVSGTVENFSTRNGLPTDQFLPGAYFISSEGRIYLGSNQGMIHFDPSTIHLNKRQPDLVLTKLEILNQEISPNNSDVLSQSIISTDKLHLGYLDKAFSLTFSALDFANPDNNQYAYKLEGFDEEWNNIGNRRVASFTSLPAGEYTLRVKGSNSDYTWNENGISLQLSIAPPPWQTWWAYAAYIVLLLAAIIWVIQYRARKFEMKIAQQEEAKALLERKVAERTEELFDKSQQLERSNKNIISSIKYAQRIQHSLLPNQSTVKELFEECFIFWQPRDIVGGDVYYIDHIEDKMVVAVVDCTGHGVPGAFMTMLASSGLRRITVDERCLDPAEILSRLNRIVQQSLQQDTDNAASDDGLDAAVCVIDADAQQLVFAGANLPLSYILEGEIETIKGDRQSLGYKRSRQDYKFTNHTLELRKSAIYYLYTDGILDQLGGKKRRMFGTRRLKETLLKSHTLPSQQHKENVIVEIEQYRANNEIQDDQTLIGFRV